MTYCSKSELLCSAMRTASSFRHTMGINAKVVNPEHLPGMQITDSCNGPCKCFKSCHNLIASIYSLCCRLKGRIIFFCPCGQVFIATPVIYKKEPVAIILFGPTASALYTKKDNLLSEKKLPLSAFLDTAKVWEVSSLIMSLNKNISGTNTSDDYFERLENNLLMDIRLKNISDFKTKTCEMIYDVCLKLSADIHSSKALILTVFMLVLNICTQSQLDVKKIFGENLRMFFELKETKYEPDAEALLKNVIENLSVAVFGKVSSRRLAISDAISYIERHFAEKLTLESLARQIYISPHYLSKAFRMETGSNFNEFLNKTRIEKAKHLLKNDSSDLKSIAQAVGFDDQSYFSKVFKKFSAMTPKEYKMRSME